MPISGEDNNISENFRPHEDEKFTLERQEIERDHINLVSKSLDIKSYIRDGLSGYTPQDRFLVSKSLSFLRKVRFF